MEALVTSIAKKVLSDWVTFPGQAKLSTGWSAQMTLHNVQVKPSAIDRLGLPLELVMGYVKRIHISAHWAAILSTPLEIEVEGIYVVARFRDQAASEKISSEVQSAKEIAELKMKQLEAWESFHLVSNDQKASMVTTILQNLKVNLKDFHFRIEFPEGPNKQRVSSVGVVFDEVFVSPTDSEFNILDKIPTVDSASNLYKLFGLRGFALYIHENAEKSELRSCSMYDPSAAQDDLFLDCELPNQYNTMDESCFEAVIQPLDMDLKSTLKNESKSSVDESTSFADANVLFEVTVPGIRLNLDSRQNALVQNLLFLYNKAIVSFHLCIGLHGRR
jgi:hypothetical protein